MKRSPELGRLEAGGQKQRGVYDGFFSFHRKKPDIGSKVGSWKVKVSKKQSFLNDVLKKYIYIYIHIHIHIHIHNYIYKISEKITAFAPSFHTFGESVFFSKRSQSVQIEGFDATKSQTRMPMIVHAASRML